jgi:hypothetical protein
MIRLGAGRDDPDVIRPSLLHNGLLALGCLAMGIGLLRVEDPAIRGAVAMGIFLLFCAAVIMAVHLPGCTGVWLDDDGFLVRDMYRSERYRWSEVGPFVLRRRVLGSGIDFAYTPPGGSVSETRSLPRGLVGSGRKIAQRMNQRRERASPAVR